MMKHLIIACVAALAVSCSKVPAGHVGIKVYLLGGDKGVDSEELGVGRYWIGINEELYLFPTFQQNYVWTKDRQEGSIGDESFTFQTKEGLSVGADIGISYHLDPIKVNTIFQKYRRGVDEITDTFLRNNVRDALNSVASNLPITSVYGAGKTALIQEVEETVKNEVGSIGIVVDKIYLIGSLRLPDTVVSALNRKIEATQRAQQRENELREAEAEAKKKVAEANGMARAKLAIAKADAEAKLLQADAEAKANHTISKSLTKPLIEYQRIKTWDGKLPAVTGGAMPFLDVKGFNK